MVQSANQATSSAKRPKSRKVWRLVLLLIVVAALVAAGVWFTKTRPQRQAKNGAVRTVPVTRGTIVQKISSTGEVKAETGADIKIGSQITGRIKHLYADVGARVTANQVLVELDAPDLAATLDSVRRNYAQATVRYQQQLGGVGMLHTQLGSAFEQATQALQSSQARVRQARAALVSAGTRLSSTRSAQGGAKARLQSAEAQLRSARAAAQLQTVQTGTDTTRAQASLSTAQSGLTEAEKTADLSVATSATALKQAQATAALAALTLKRQEALLARGFVAAADVDSTRTQRDVTAQQVQAAENNLDSAKAQAQARVQAAKDAVAGAQAGLVAAQAGPYQDTIRTEAIRSAESSLEDSRANVAQAELAIESAKADVTTAQAQVASADNDVRSAQAARRTALGNLTQNPLKQQDVKAAYQAMQQAKAQVALQEAQFDKSYIRTPITGTVLSLTQQEGETVVAGLSAPTLLEVAAMDRMEVIAYVDETDIAKVRLGQTAQVTVEAFQKTKFTGKVYKISSAATMQQNVVTYPVSVRLDKYRIGMLKPQMTADVQIILSQANNLLLAPNEAVKQKRGVTQVVVLTGDQAVVQDITTGRSEGNATEVLTGLKEGDNLVVSGFEKLGIEGFSSTAGVPGFMNRTPFGPAGATKGGGGGGGGFGGGGR
jgi:RND family efflux transporter MFP subunit